MLKHLNELYSRGDHPAALVEAQKLEAAAKARFGVNHINYAIALHNLAMVSAKQGKYGEAEDLFKRALSIREIALGANHPGTAAAACCIPSRPERDRLCRKSKRCHRISLVGGRR